MKFNEDWRYRQLHDFNILVNMRSNEIVVINSIYALLFAYREESESFEEAFLKWRKAWNFVEPFALQKMEDLKKRGIVNE